MFKQASLGTGPESSQLKLQFVVTPRAEGKAGPRKQLSNRTFPTLTESPENLFLINSIGQKCLMLLD